MAQYLSPAVYIEEVPSGNKPIEAAGTSTGAFVGIAEKGPIGLAVPVQNFAQFAGAFGTFIDDGYLAFAVKAFFDEGGTSCYVTRTCHYTGSTPAPTAVTTTRTFVSTGDATEDSLTIAASSPGTWGDDIAVEITHQGDLFTIGIEYLGAPVVTFPDLTMDPASRDYVETRINAEPVWDQIIEVTSAVPHSSGQSFASQRPAATTGHVFLTAGGGTSGNDGITTAPDADDFVGDEAAGSGLHSFDKVDGIRVVCMPDAPADAHGRGMAYCARRGDCFYVADGPEAADTADDVLNYKTAQGIYAGTNALNSKYGALYVPWIQVFDSRSGGRITVPPSGAMLGRYADTDSKRGVHKAPAGTVDGRLRSVLGLAVDYTSTDQEKLNPKGINVIRRFTGLGNVAWGARTVSSDPEWRYVNVRRLFLMIETSILDSTKWVVHEPNDRNLWAAVVRNVSAFLRIQWRAGALVGATEEQAFYVKCDEETNPPASVALGRLITDIGVAPSKPAEFVIFRISQFQGGADVSE